MICNCMRHSLSSLLHWTIVRYGGGSFTALIHQVGQTFWHLLDCCLHCPYLTEKWKGFFSVLKIIKVDRRSSLGNNSSLRDILTANADGISMKDFDPDPSIELWWKDIQVPHGIDAEDSTSDDNEAFILDDWDDWLGLGDSRSIDITL